LYDASAQEGRALTVPGIRPVPGGTLVDRALRFLGAGPSDSATLAREVLGLTRFTRGIAERVTVALLGADPRVQRLADDRWVLVSDTYASPRIGECTFAVVDVETTGSRPAGGDRIIEIAVVTLCDGRIQRAFETLLDPRRAVSRHVTSLTRITPDMLRGRPTFEDVAAEIVAALAGRVFVAHNLRFDWRFVTSEIRRTRDLLLEGPTLCTVDLARRLLPGLRSRGLDSLANYFGIEIQARHRAGGDAIATAQVLRRLLDLAVEQGAGRLIDLHRLGRRARRRRRRNPLPGPMEQF